MPDFHVQRFICAACLDPAFLKILCIEKLMTANCSAEMSNSTHAAYLFDGAYFQHMQHSSFTFVLTR